MADKKNLRDMLDAIIKDKSEEAQTNFHAYATAKMKEILHGEETGGEEAGAEAEAPAAEEPAAEEPAAQEKESAAEETE